MSPPPSPTEDDSTPPNDESEPHPDDTAPPNDESTQSIDDPVHPNTGSTPQTDEPDSRVREPSSTATEDQSTPNTLLNALIGAVITVLTSFFIPFAPILGGATAGYLEGRDGVKVGAISGAMALVPLLFLVPLVLLFFFLDPFIGLGILFVGFFVLAFLLVYTVGLSALGGVIGVYLKQEL